MKGNLVIIFFCIVVIANAQQKTDIYIDKYKDVAIAEMNIYGIPASITLAQGILESGNGESRLAVEGKNHFGIKCHSNWNGETIIEDDDVVGECFRKYNRVEDSYRDHSLFLAERERYSFLFKYNRKDYKSWAKGLQKAGYATNPKYSKLLIDLIERNNLYRFDNTEIENKRLYFSRTYGFPYLLGLGIDYIKVNRIYNLDIQTSFAFSKVSFGFNYNFMKELYTGTNISMIYLPYRNHQLSPQLSFGLLYKKNLVSKKNKYVLFKMGMHVPLDGSFPMFSYNSQKLEYSVIPYLELRYLLH